MGMESWVRAKGNVNAEGKTDLKKSTSAYFPQNDTMISQLKIFFPFPLDYCHPTFVPTTEKQ
jgi:hypothetical protein